jgi:phage gpG-like protein
MPKLGFSRGKKTVVKLTGVEVQMQWASTDEMRDYLQSLSLRAKDLQVPLARFGQYLVEKHIPQQFEKQGTPKRWAPLSPKYAAWKKRHYGNLPKLVLTGQMRESFTYVVTPRTLRVENRRKYWAYHQTGTRTMPARPPLQMTTKDREQLRELVRAWIMFETGGGVL